MVAAKKTTKNVFDLLNLAKTDTIGTHTYIGFKYYQKTVLEDPEHEYSTTVKDYRNNNYGVVMTDIEKCTNNLSSFVFDTSSVAVIHNHPNQSILSPLDIISLIHASQSSLIRTMIAWDTKNDIYYCATIYDTAKANAFFNKYRCEVDSITHDWGLESDIYKYQKEYKRNFRKIKTKDNVKVADLLSMSNILNHFDSGLSITTITNEKKEDGSKVQNYSAYSAKNSDYYAKYYRTINYCELIICTESE